MPAEITRWRAAISHFNACFKCKLVRILGLCVILFQILELYWFLYHVIAVATFILPSMLTIKFSHLSFCTNVMHFQLVKHHAQVCKFARYSTTRPFHIKCKVLCMLDIYWFHNSILLLSGDIEANPSPETLKFFNWNLNSIIAHEFIRVSFRGLELCLQL